MRLKLLFFALLLASPLLTRGSTPNSDTISVFIVGDVMQHYKQLRAALISHKDSTDASAYDYSECFKYVEDRYKNADYTIANMEFTTGVIPYTGYPLFSAPVSLAQEMQRIGTDLFLCANNHLCDKGKRGLDSTIVNYERYDMPYTGIYKDVAQEYNQNPYITKIGDIKIAFINFTYGLNGHKVAEPFRVSTLDKEEVEETINRANERGADIIIALPHWGNEYSLKQSAYQEDWKQFLMDKGVNIIIGSHPHVIQPIEVEMNAKGEIFAITAYSLGNVISNMTVANSQVGAMVTLKLTKDSDGNVKIVGLETELTWSAIAGRVEDNYTIIPIKEFIGKKEYFRSEFEYKKMIDTYNSIKHIIEY